MLTVLPCAAAHASYCRHLLHKGHQLAAHQHHTTAAETSENSSAHKGLTCRWASFCPDCGQTREPSMAAGYGLH